jgi:hypothetical protein
MWSVTKSPNFLLQGDPTVSNELLGVSCVATTDCVAVGYTDLGASHEDQALIETWNGSRWELSYGADDGDEQLTGVSCASASSCMAVGNYVEDGGPLAESWNGSEWSITPIPSPTNASLEAVSCAGPSTCVAVGDYGQDGVQYTLVESWDGSVWSVVASPNPSDETGGPELDGVSCSGPSNCEAVGSYQDESHANQTLAESWSGAAWSIVPSPSPGNGGNTQLFGVSCANVSSCTAVGYFREKTLIESWNGTTWSAVPSPNPTSGTQTQLFGVACPKSSQCVAVGGYFLKSGQERTLVESWKGTSWGITPSPGPGKHNPNPVSTLPQLNGVSCPRSDGCVAVGYYLGRTGALRTLVETGTA